MTTERETKIWETLRAPFAPEQIGKLPKGGALLDFVGHAAVTDRLLKADPMWNWEPLAFDDHGLPAFTRDAQAKPVGLWIKLTIGGVTRLGVGSVAANAFDAEKQLIGDALRNAAMRFGVALDLWTKEDLHRDEDHPPRLPDPQIDVPAWVGPFNAARKERGITALQLAEVLGASGTITNIERWMAEEPELRTPDKLLSLAADLVLAGAN
jgi:hypothetical protein